MIITTKILVTKMDKIMKVDCVTQFLCKEMVSIWT